MSESSKESNDIRCLPIQAEAWVIWPHSTCGARRASCGAKAHPGPVRDRAVNGRGGYGHARTGRPLRRDARKKALVGALVGVGAGRRRTAGRFATAPSTGAEDTGTPAQGGPCDAMRARKRSWVRLWVWVRVYADTPGCMVFFHSETAKLAHPGPGARVHSRSQHGAGPCPLPGAPTCGRLEKTYTRGLFDPLAGRFALRLCLQNRGETLIRQSRRCHFGADKIVGWQMNLIQTLEAEEIARLNKTIPDFSAGDPVNLNVNVVEGSRKRVQAYEGVVIAKRNRGLNSGFIVRKISSGEGVERTFQTYSPLIASIEVKRRGDVRRAKLYYLRERSGKSARIKEKLPARTKAAPASAA